MTIDIKQVLMSAGGQDWTMLSDAHSDSEFQQILTTQEKNFLRDLNGNPHTINSYRDYFATIVAKYIGWKAYKDSNLKKINKEINDLSEHVKKSEEELKVIKDSARYIGGATVLVEYSKSFATSAKDHEDSAHRQFVFYIISLLCLAMIVWVAFSFSIAESTLLNRFISDDLKKGLPLNTGFFVFKAILLFFVFQITQFFRKNYGAEKHLQEVYKHRSDVLQSLHAVYNALSDQTEKDRILSAGALFAYERGETGYITTKEGAGSGDDFLGGVITKLLK